MDLYGSRAKLKALEAEFRESIHPKMGEMQAAMCHSYHRVQYVLTQLQHFDLSRSVEASSKQKHHDLYLRPQIQWLSSHLDAISEKLKIANNAATEARNDTVDYVTRVTDVGEKIRHIQVDLETTQSGLQELASKAHSHLCSVKKDMADTEVKVKATQGKITERNRRVVVKRFKMFSPLIRQAATKVQASGARNKAEAKKFKAFQRFVSALRLKTRKSLNLPIR